MSKSLYTTLEVGENASAEEIKKSYRKLARKYHPDINKDAGAEAKFKEINAAYEILGDKDKRAKYDQIGDSMFGGQNFSDFARAQGGADFDINDILSQIFGQQGGFNSFGQSRGGGFGGFGGGFGGFAEDLDINARISIPLADALLGGKQQVSLDGENIDFKIPVGVPDGGIIRIKGKGRHSQRGQGRGDLMLKINIVVDEPYSIEDGRLYRSFDLPLKTALLGGKVKIPTIYKEITLKVPKDTKNGQRFRAKELGLKDRKSGHTDDLMLRANIVLPRSEDLTSAFIEELEKLKD